MALCLHELCMNQEIQTKAQRDIDQVLENNEGRMTYEAIMEMRYLEDVISETLRKYPVLPVLNRDCNKDYHVPNSNVVIEKGTPIMIPIIGLHRDPKYYPDPDTFDPQRFCNESVRSRHPYSYVPFGEGPRACIGIRMGKMQAKVGLASLLSTFTFSSCSKTQHPLAMHPNSILISPRDGLWMNVTKRNKSP